MTTKSMFRRSTPSAFTSCSKILELFPVSNRMRLPPYSTRAANPKSIVREGDLPNASYRMVTRFGVSAAAIPASKRTITARARSEGCRFMGSSLSFVCNAYIHGNVRISNSIERPATTLIELFSTAQEHDCNTSFRQGRVAPITHIYADPLALVGPRHLQV